MRTYLRIGRLIDGRGGAPIEDAVIRIDGARIGRVGPAAALGEAVDPDAWVDFAAGTALPGLVDAHTHFSLSADGRSYEEMALDPDELMAINGARNALRHLRSGVTTARDNGARNRVVFVLREAIERGYAEGPRLLVSGRPLTCSAGHFHWCNGVADGELEIRRAVRRLVAEGADHIKIMASGGGTVGTDPTRASYTVAELRAAVETAHELGRPTTSHCRALESMRRAMEAGSDCLEHGEFLTPGGEMSFDEETGKRLVDSGIYLSPTLQASGWDTILRLREKRETSGLDATETSALAATERETEERLAQVGRLLQLGMGPRIVAGTDAGCFDFSFGHMDYALDLLAKAGMTPMQAIIAGTSVAAAACGVADEAGILEAGRPADILIVDGDPLTDIAAVGRVTAVYQGGRRVT